MTADPARAAKGSPEQKGSPRNLRRTRREAREFLKESRRLTKRYGKRIDPAKLAQVEEAQAAVDSAVAGDDADKIAGSVKKLDGLVEKHLGFARRSPALEYTISIAKALAIALVLRLFVVEAFKIPSGSMIPTLLIGDHIFVNKLSYGVRLPVVNWELAHWGGYKRGDIVVFSNPLDDRLPLLERRDFIKRVVGLPGDTVEVRNEVVYVNGVAQPRERVDSDFTYYDRMGDNGPWYETSGELWKETLLGSDGKVSRVHDVLRDDGRGHQPYEGPFHVPEGHLFMMGDNRDNSQDGRAGGWYVPFGHVKGRALVIWLSLGKPGLWFWGDGSGIRFDRLFHTVH